MAAGNWKILGAALQSMIKGDLDVDIATRLILVKSTWSPNQSVHATFADVSANEVTAGGGYATYGKLVTPSVTRTGLAVKYSGNNQTWAASTITAKYAVLVQDINADGVIAPTDKLIAYTDLETTGGSLSSTASDFNVSVDPVNGMAVFTAS